MTIDTIQSALIVWLAWSQYINVRALRREIAALSRSPLERM